MTPVAGQPPGSIIQFAYTVADAEAAALSYAKELNIGPWFLRGPLMARKPVYRGKAQELRLSIAIAYSGHMMIELIQQHDDGPSVYREAVARSGYGFHHHGIASVNFDADCADYAARGYDLVFTDQSPAGTRVAYFDAKRGFPGFVELIEIVPASIERYEGMYHAARTWDGRDPIRKV